MLDIAYNVTLRRLRTNQLSGDGACKSQAARKREKWSTIPAFVVATAGRGARRGVDRGFVDVRRIRSVRGAPVYTPGDDAAPRRLRRGLCVGPRSQNLLLSLHSEGLGTKWATGPVARTRALRDLVGCGEGDAVVGLVMVRWPKRMPRMRRRREVEGDVLRDV